EPFKPRILQKKTCSHFHVARRSISGAPLRTCFSAPKTRAQHPRYGVSARTFARGAQVAVWTCLASRRRHEAHAPTTSMKRSTVKQLMMKCWSQKSAQLRAAGTTFTISARTVCSMVI
ncbi:hypothetical protein F441_17576, partial [Phytophthora nicotianae CJ01A1]